MSRATLSSSKRCKVFLLGASTLVCLALSTPAMATDFVITFNDGSTNGFGTEDGATAADIADGAINGDDTVSLGIAIATGANAGISTTNEDNVVDGNTITVSDTGSITTTGIFAHGILNGGDDIETNVSGNITTEGFTAWGIYNWGSNNGTNVSGNITTEGDTAWGIYNLGSNNETNVSGNITTKNRQGSGIVIDGSNNGTIVSGSIATEGYYAFAISNNGVYNETIFSGSITTKGNWSVGIYNDGVYNETIVSGSITTKGNNAHGIVIDGDANKTTISGYVKANGANAAALYIDNGDGNSFTLNEGAIIIGDVLAKDDATNSELIFNLGSSTSYAYSVSGKGEGTGGGQWIFSDLDRSSQVVTTSGTGCDTTINAGNDTCNLVTAVGAANAEVQNELQYITSTSLINSLRLDTPVNTSQEETTATDVWFDAYGVSTERDASTWDTTGVVFNADTRGLTIGKPLVLGESFGLDLVFNTSQTDLDVGATKHQNIAAQSFNFGVVMTDLASSSNWDVDAFGFIGRNSYEGKRKVMNNQVSTGSETVTSSYSGTKALVGFDVDYTTPINEAVSFKGGINANLSNEAIGAYSESKYSTWNARTVSQAASGISVGLTHKRDLLTTFVTLGAEYSSLLSGEKASYTNNGTATSYTDHDASDDMISSVAVGFKYAGTNGVSFEGSIKGSSSNKGLTSTSANFGLNWAF